MTNIHKPNAVAYLLFYILLFIFIFGIVYALLSDVRDFFPPIFTSLSSQTEYNDTDYLWGFDVLNFLLSFSVVFAIIGLVWYSYELSQKPLRPW